MSTTARKNVLALSTILLWSTAFPITRRIAGEFASSNLAFTRCLIASIYLVIIWSLQKNRRFPTLKDSIYFILAGLTGFSVYLIFFNIGLTTITSAESSVIVALTPIWVACISHMFLGEKLSIIGWCTTIGAFVGVAILMLWGNGLNIQPGMLWTLSASVMFSSYMQFNRTLSARGYSSIDVVTWSMVIACISLAWALPGTLAQLPELSRETIIATLYLGIFPSGISYALWGGALAIANKASDVTNFMFITPLLATLEGIVFLSEVPTTGTYLGGGLILAMVVTYNLSKK